MYIRDVKIAAQPSRHPRKCGIFRKDRSLTGPAKARPPFLTCMTTEVSDHLLALQSGRWFAQGLSPRAAIAVLRFDRKDILS